MGADPFKGQPHNIQPYYEQGVRQTPHHIKREALSYIKKLIDEKIIEPQCQVTSWCSPGFFVYRGGSNKLRFVIDYVYLNAAIR